MIIKLAILLNNDLDQNNKVITLLAICYNENTNSKVETKTDPLSILATTIYKANKVDDRKFTLLTKLNIENLKLTSKQYTDFINSNKPKQSKKTPLAKKDKTWSLVLKQSIQPCHKPL